MARGSRRHRRDVDVGSPMDPPTERRKCPCDDDPVPLDEQREWCEMHDGPEYDLDPWGEPR